MKKVLSVFIVSIMIITLLLPALSVSALDNGLAKTPPLGWNSWNIFQGKIDETKIKQIADTMVSSGMRDAGYVYLNLDDNWMANPARDANGNLIPDPTRFPSGMKALADYVHSKGLKLGIYGDHGTMTCMNVPQSGSYGHEVQDANTYAAWGIDYLKEDNCNLPTGDNAQADYEKMRDALKNSGRDIVFSICAWEYKDWMPATGNLWRTTGDITDKWDNGPTNWFRGIINLIDENMQYVSSAGPGAWNDPDMLEIGNGGCTTEEYRTQMSMWSMMASPLIAGNDIRSMSQATKDILLNTEVIAIDQDSLGKQCTKVIDNGDTEVFTKPLANGDMAVALLNRGSTGTAISATAAQLGLTASEGYLVRDLWKHSNMGSAGTISAYVPSHGTAMFRVSKASIADLQAYPANLNITVSSYNSSAKAGKTVQLTATVNNSGVKNVTNAAFSLQLPDGWTASPLTSVNFASLAAGQSATAVWGVTPSFSTQDIKDIGVTMSYTDGTSTAQIQGSTSLIVLPPNGTEYLSNLTWTSSTNGWGPVEKDMSVGNQSSGDGTTITLEGAKYSKGLGTNSASTVIYNIGGNYNTFISDVGIDDDVGSKGSVVFTVYGDNIELWNSGLMTGSTPTKTVNVSVQGVQTLKLVVTDGGDGNGYDHGDWAGASLIAPTSGNEGDTYLSNLTWTSSTNGWGPVEKDMSVGNQSSGDGTTITLEGVNYSKGLGTNAASTVIYNIGANYDAFISDVGIDDDVGSKGSVVFTVYGDNIELWNSGLMTGSTPTKTVNVSVQGVQTLKLVVTDGGDGNGYDHGDWAGARLVTAPPVAVTGVTLDKSALTLVVGNTGKLTATVAPSNATNKTVTFISDNAAVSVGSAVYDAATGTASVTLTANSAGTAIITAITADECKAAQCSVTVNLPEAIKPFNFTSSGVLGRIGGLQATVKVNLTDGIATHSGDEVVLFQLMKGNTPESIVALKRDITSQEEFTAYFNVNPADTTYTVRVYVLDSFSSDMTAPISLAEQVTLN